MMTCVPPGETELRTSRGRGQVSVGFGGRKREERRGNRNRGPRLAFMPPAIAPSEEIKPPDNGVTRSTTFRAEVRTVETSGAKRGTAHGESLDRLQRRSAAARFEILHPEAAPWRSRLRAGIPATPARIRAEPIFHPAAGSARRAARWSGDRSLLVDRDPSAKPICRTRLLRSGVDQGWCSRRAISVCDSSTLALRSSVTRRPCPGKVIATAIRLLTHATSGGRGWWLSPRGLRRAHDDLARAAPHDRLDVDCGRAPGWAALWNLRDHRMTPFASTPNGAFARLVSIASDEK